MDFIEEEERLKKELEEEMPGYNIYLSKYEPEKSYKYMMVFQKPGPKGMKNEKGKEGIREWFRVEQRSEFEPIFEKLRRFSLR